MKKQKAFTLIELLVVIAIIGLLSSIVLVAAKTVREKARRTAGLHFAAQVHHALGAEAVGIWDFNEGSGTTARDSSGYGNNGTLYNFAAPHGWVSGGDNTPSGTGYALSFDGVDDYVNCVNCGVKVNIPGDVTHTAWIKITVAPNESDAIIRHNGVANISMRLTTSRKLDHNYYDSGGAWRTVTDNGPFSVATGEWTHVVVVRDMNINKVKFYYNGMLSSQVDLPSSPTTSPSANITIGSFGGGQWFSGLIDDVRIYSQSLTQAQVEALYAEGAERHGLLAEK